MRHPNFHFASKSTEQAIYVHCRPFVLLNLELCVPVFLFFSGHDILCIMPGNCLESIANAEDWNIEFEDPTRRPLDGIFHIEGFEFTLDRVWGHLFHRLNKVRQRV